MDTTGHGEWFNDEGYVESELAISLFYEQLLNAVLWVYIGLYIRNKCEIRVT
jgi:hypothetical protein